MSELTFLSQYGAGEILAILIVALFLVVGLLRATSFIWDKIKEHFEIESSEDRWKATIGEKIDNISENIATLQRSVKDLEIKADKRGQRLEKVEQYIREDVKREQEIIENSKNMKKAFYHIQARLQDDTRWSFKDAYNYYVLQTGKIDTHTLEALETKYKHYKEAGGNSFVDNIMEKIRELPIVEHIGD